MVETENRLRMTTNQDFWPLSVEVVLSIRVILFPFESLSYTNDDNRAQESHMI
jgi:hypothetical protein